MSKKTKYSSERLPQEKDEIPLLDLVHSPAVSNRQGGMYAGVPTTQPQLFRATFEAWLQHYQRRNCGTVVLSSGIEAQMIRRFNDPSFANTALGQKFDFAKLYANPTIDLGIVHFHWHTYCHAFVLLSYDASLGHTI